MSKRVRPSVLTPVIRWNAYSRDYERRLVKFVKALVKSVSYHSMAVLHGEEIITYDSSAEEAPRKIRLTLQELFKKWDGKTSDFAKRLSRSQMKRLLKYVQGQYKPLLGEDAEKKTKRLKELLRARFEENYALIKSIASDVKKRLEPVLYGAITSGNQAEIMKQLNTISGITVRQARRIARDQTAKALEAFNMAQAQEVGLEYYVWDTCRDERVSTGYGGHKQLDGKIFRYDTPEAVVDSYGNKGHPTQRVNCRCISRGVFLQEGERIKRAKDGIGYEVVKA